MRQIFTSCYLQDSNNTMLILDPKAVQSALRELEDQIQIADSKYRDLEEKVRLALDLDAFVREHHPDIIKEFLVTRLTKLRLEVGGK